MVTRRLQDLVLIPQMLAASPLPGDLTHRQGEEGGRKLLALGSGLETALFCQVKPVRMSVLRAVLLVGTIPGN